MMPTPFQDQLSAYLDGELDDAEAARLEAELRVNPTLRAELEELRELVGFVRSTGRVSAPSGFHARVMAAVDAEAPPTPWWAWLRRPFGVPIEGIAVALAAAAVLLFSLPRPPADEAIAPETPAKAPVAANEGKERPPEPAEEQHLDPVQNAYELDGVADVDQVSARQGEGEAVQQEAYVPVQKVAGPKTAPAPAPAPSPEALASSGTSAEIGASVGTVAPQPSGTAEARPPSTLPSHQYRVYAEGASILAALQRAAARYQGEVRDSTGQVVRTGTQSADVATYRVRIRASALQDFYRDLERMAVEVQANDSRSGEFAEIVDVEVTVVLLGPARLGSEAAIDQAQ